MNREGSKNRERCEIREAHIIFNISYSSDILSLRILKIFCPRLNPKYQHNTADK